MNIKDLRNKTPSQLHKHLDKLNSEISDITRESYNRSEKNVHKLRNIRKEVARTLTVLKEQISDNDQMKESA